MTTFQPAKNGIIGLKELCKFGSLDYTGAAMTEDSIGNNYDTNVFANNKSLLNLGNRSLFSKSAQILGLNSGIKGENGILRFAKNNNSPSIFSNSSESANTASMNTARKIKTAGCQTGAMNPKSASIFG